MPTIGEVYDPLVTAALQDDPRGHELLSKTGSAISLANPTMAPTQAQGFAAACRNLDYYVQYMDEATSQKVKAFYNLGSGFRTLDGQKLN